MISSKAPPNEFDRVRHELIRASYPGCKRLAALRASPRDPMEEVAATRFDASAMLQRDVKRATVVPRRARRIDDIDDGGERTRQPRLVSAERGVGALVVHGTTCDLARRLTAPRQPLVVRFQSGAGQERLDAPAPTATSVLPSIRAPSILVPPRSMPIRSRRATPVTPSPSRECRATRAAGSWPASSPAPSAPSS